MASTVVSSQNLVVELDDQEIEFDAAKSSPGSTSTCAASPRYAGLGTGGPILGRQVVFACNSNSCRSQMAEGWAREWIEKQRLTYPDESAESKQLDGLRIFSVALDDGAVFKQTLDSSNETCCGDLCNSIVERKQVKAKAVEAMAWDGIDISKCYPKTFAELQEADTHGQPFAPGLNQSGAVLENLVIVCDCAGSKFGLSDKALSVSEWQIEAPTAAATAGEGDQAYLRVSRQIKAHVFAYMSQLLQM